MVGGGIRGGFSHPLTINPGLLNGRPASALATFPHEQLHWSVCALEFRSLGEIIGPALAAAELGQLGRHGLHVPEQPPVPRRYCGADWWTSLGGERLAQTEVIAAGITDAGVAGAVGLVDGLLEDLDASGAQ
jgi:hypothetical protein